MLPVALSSSSSCLPHGTTLTKATTKKKILSNCKNFCIADRLEQIVQVEMKPLENILLTMIFLASSVVVACGLRAGNNNKWDEKKRRESDNKDSSAPSWTFCWWVWLYDMTKGCLFLEGS
jgi:hypothetical protein